MGPYGSKNFKTLLFLQFSLDLSQNLYDKQGSYGGIKTEIVLAICELWRTFMAL